MRAGPMRSSAVLIVLACAALWTTSTARSATIMGTGITISCGGWVEIRKTPNKGAVEEWSLGYLSGVAMWTPVSPLDGLDAGAVMVWLDNFCQRNPLVPFKAALDEFVRQRAAAITQQQQQPRPAPTPAPTPAPVPAPQSRR